MRLSLLTLALVAPGIGQAPADADPYTGSDGAALTKVGYRSLGPFAWGDEGSTIDVEAELGVALRWVETEHFKIGSGLRPRTIDGTSRERRRLQDELTELASKLPQIDRRTRRLDPWLRLHLFADRAERLYADFAGRLPKDLALRPGPLGERGKFCLLLLERQSDLGRYLRAFARRTKGGPCCHSFLESGERVFATCAERRDGGGVMSDIQLHCEVGYGLVLNFHASCTSGHDSPLWWREGLCHWFQRRIDARYDSATATSQGPLDLPTGDWATRVRARVKTGAFPDAATTVGWRALDDLGRAEHMFAWSRVDFLMSLGDAGFARFIHQLRHQRWSPAKSSAEARVEWHRRALVDAWSLTLDQFDRQWAEFARRH